MKSLLVRHAGNFAGILLAIVVLLAMALATILMLANEAIVHAISKIAALKEVPKEPTLNK